MLNDRRYREQNSFSKTILKDQRSEVSAAELSVFQQLRRNLRGAEDSADEEEVRVQR